MLEQHEGSDGNQKKTTLRKHKKRRLALAFGYALGMNVQCVLAMIQ